MLKVLANGLRSVEDIQLYTRKGIFAQVMALYGAALLDKRCMVCYVIYTFSLKIIVCLVHSGKLF